MEMAGFKDMQLSKLMLGTVQLGLDYGIANRSGKPSYDEAKAIIACAYDGGVNCLDTAAAYGDSETVLGKALSELGILHKMIVVTKVPPIPESTSSKEADSIVETSVINSLKHLRIEVLPICLLHAEGNICFFESLLKLKDKGLIRYAGISTMTPCATKHIIGLGVIDALQIPTNILDRRFTGSGITSSAADKGLALFVRSMYLQGLLLMPEETIMSQLRDVIPVIRNLKKLADSFAMDISELAARYVWSVDGLTSALVGVDSTEQMRKNIAYFTKGPLSVDVVLEVKKTVPDLDQRILMPNMWQTG